MLYVRYVSSRDNKDKNLCNKDGVHQFWGCSKMSNRRVSVFSHHLIMKSARHRMVICRLEAYARVLAAHGRLALCEPGSRTKTAEAAQLRRFGADLASASGAAVRESRQASRLYRTIRKKLRLTLRPPARRFEGDACRQNHASGLMPG